MKKSKMFKKTSIFLAFFMFIIPGIVIGSEPIVLENRADFNVLQPEWYFKPDSYSELVDWYSILEQQFPNYIEIFKANELYNTGIVDGGYDLYYVRITNESLGFHKPEVLFLGGPHGDETVGTIGLYWFTNWLMRKAVTDEPCVEYSKEWLKWLVDNREIYIEICHNPYGFDSITRTDANGWDLNREADYDGPGNPTGGIWASVNGRTLRAFVDNHTIMAGCDFHGGVRLLLYPWSSTHDDLEARSKITGETYHHVPPDFFYFDVSSLRLGRFMGGYGGILDSRRVGPSSDVIDYEAQGSLTPWGYGADVERHPSEDIFVEDEIFGNYPGSGILWVTPEISNVKNPDESTFGNDTINRYGAEVRRFVLHQTDLAQPYLRWAGSTPSNNSVVPRNTSLSFKWQVNGSLVVDETILLLSNFPNSFEFPDWESENLAVNESEYSGGTGWDDASNGAVSGITYEKTITLNDCGDYYIVAKAKVDQAYKKVIKSAIYGDNSFLRLIQERTNESYVEIINGTDGVEEINGQLWWYSPVVHIKVADNYPPSKPLILSSEVDGFTEMPYDFEAVATDLEGNDIQYGWDWGDGLNIEWTEFYSSGQSGTISHIWDNAGIFNVKVKARDLYGEGIWSDDVVIVINKSFMPELEIEKPINTIYLNDKELIPFEFLQKPVVFGDITITVNILSDLELVDNISFIYDDQIVKTDQDYPFDFLFSENSFGKTSIKIDVYSLDGRIYSEIIEFWKFF